MNNCVQEYVCTISTTKLQSNSTLNKTKIAIVLEHDTNMICNVVSLTLKNGQEI